MLIIHNLLSHFSHTLQSNAAPDLDDSEIDRRRFAPCEKILSDKDTRPLDQRHVGE